MKFLPHASKEGFTSLMKKIERLNDELGYVDEKYVKLDQKSLEKKTDEFFRDFISFWGND